MKQQQKGFTGSDYLEAARDLLLPGIRSLGNEFCGAGSRADIEIDKAHDKLLLKLLPIGNQPIVSSCSGTSIKDGSFRLKAFSNLREAANAAYISTSTKRVE